jgi:hypothetical protein
MVIVESVLIMLPKDEALKAIHSLLMPGGILAINEGLRLSGEKEQLKDIEKEFEKIGTTWSLPAYEEWKNYLERNNFMVLSDTSPIPYNITWMGLESFLRSPVITSIRFIRMLFNNEARRFFSSVMMLMARASVRWGYCLWICKRE